ncbi:hypothetical protein ACIQXD_14435 [Streptomyces uncialis]|uniref:hypothetical protein n=1 Tax=Streptomyces uncialis TaxID=1048205 RepID=UPI003821EF1C
MDANAHDRFGTPLAPGDAVELFRVAGGSTGGDARGWRGGIPGTVAKVNDPQHPGRVLVELDKPTGYPAPNDKALEWAELRTTVKAAETA